MSSRHLRHLALTRPQYPVTAHSIPRRNKPGVPLNCPEAMNLERQLSTAATAFGCERPTTDYRLPTTVSFPFAFPPPCLYNGGLNRRPLWSRSRCITKRALSVSAVASAPRTIPLTSPNGLAQQAPRTRRAKVKCVALTPVFSGRFDPDVSRWNQAYSRVPALPASRLL